MPGDLNLCCKALLCHNLNSYCCTNIFVRDWKKGQTRSNKATRCCFLIADPYLSRFKDCLLSSNNKISIFPILTNSFLGNSVTKGSQTMVYLSMARAPLFHCGICVWHIYTRRRAVPSPLCVHSPFIQGFHSGYAVLGTTGTILPGCFTRVCLPAMTGMFAGALGGSRTSEDPKCLKASGWAVTRFPGGGRACGVDLILLRLWLCFLCLFKGGYSEICSIPNPEKV